MGAAAIAFGEKLWVLRTDGMGISSVSGVGLTTIKHFWRLLAGLLAHFCYWEICWVVVAKYQLEASSQ